MTKKLPPPKEFSYQGVNFCIDYSNPSSNKHKSNPCRGRITPRDPLTGKRLTKRQLFGKDSDQPVNHIVHGKDSWDIYNNRETEASYLISMMAQVGLLDGLDVSDPAEAVDLAELARNFKRILFELHPKWTQGTVKDYSSQYDKVVEAMVGLRAGDLDETAYRQLQEKICLTAVKSATKNNTWKYGELPPASARKRLSLLCDLIRHLKLEGASIPVVPFPYNGKPSRQEQLLDRTDHARTLPDELLRAICADPIIRGQAEVLADTGLRIRECVGLLFDSLHWVDTSQGRMYYLDINGQIGDDGKRTERLKTKDSYRMVPLSQELGEFLICYRQEMEALYGDLSLRLMCGQPGENEFDDGPDQAGAWEDQVRKRISGLLRNPSSFQLIAANRVYIFDKEAQDRELYSELFCHAQRRNYCTWLYCFSGLDSPEIFRYMGHAYKNLPPKTAAGLNSEELRRMCLRKHVSPTLYHPSNPLRYVSDGAIQATEVSTCAIELKLKPGESIEMTVEDTEPGNVIHIAGEGLAIQRLRRDERRNVTYNYGLLPAEKVTTIVKKRKLLE